MWLFKPSKVSLSLTSSGHMKKKVGTAVWTLYSRPPPDALALTRSLNLSELCWLRWMEPVQLNAFSPTFSYWSTTCFTSWLNPAALVCLGCYTGPFVPAVASLNPTKPLAVWPAVPVNPSDIGQFQHVTEEENNGNYRCVLWTYPFIFYKHWFSQGWLN